MAWQLSRAVETVYGARVPAREIADRHLVTDAEGRVAPRTETLELRPDHARPALTGGGPMFVILTAVACVLWLLLVALLLRAYRAGVGDARRRGLLWGMLALVMVFFLALVVVVLTGLARPWLASALVEIPVRALGQSAAATTAAWVSAVALLVLAYRLAESQFLRMEIPTRPTKFTLIDLARGEG